MDYLYVNKYIAIIVIVSTILSILIVPFLLDKWTKNKH